jgi:hypothetical protein
MYKQMNSAFAAYVPPPVKLNEKWQLSQRNSQNRENMWTKFRREFDFNHQRKEGRVENVLEMGKGVE